MISKRQLEANRRNALKATGPRTPEGKDVARLNSLRHGLASACAITSSEDERLFDDRFSAFADHYRPVGPFETLLVANLAVATLRLERVRKLETEFYNRRLEQQSEEVRRLDSHQRNALVFLQDARGSNRLTRLSRYEARAENAFYHALHELERIRAARGQSAITERTHSQNRTPPRLCGEAPAAGMAVLS